MAEFFARSASDKTDDWPFWFVARRDQPGRNVLVEAIKIAGFEYSGGWTLTCREAAELIAKEANKKESRQ
ncbi:MAG: hypothetical protein LCH38_10985 [Proteobacteria bacterium]|nr:hypothetical protein [Pseudomonadota bacterium]